ncbi:MAG: carboxylesterase/lipase family protein [Candidatus Leucobacter sulfamidivorax]|nr:carboxylesterase/lipase family protein [Candidatus Leucobacter sulfamidivorax]
MAIRRSGYAGQVVDGVERYLGIQYAEPGPSGRFSASAVIGGRRQAAADSLDDVPVFPQLPSRLSAAMGRRVERNPQVESAFFLNVWTPVRGSRLPVLFFIHGGAWMTGGGSASWYDGRALSARGMVVVTCNYRLGPLAHLTEPGSGGSRNPALSDLLAALRWVRENIARFGGDPEAVTVAGQSAGSWYAHLLCVSDAARGLLGRVAHLSHASNRPWTPARQDRLCEEVRRELGLGSLRDAGVPELLEAGRRAATRTEPGLGAVPTPYLPTTDAATADLLCSAPESARASHARAVYLRTTGTETSAFFFDSPRERQVDADAVARLRASTAGGAAAAGGSARTPYEELVAITSEHFFDGPSRALADAYADRGIPTYLRAFEARSELDGFLSGHCFDLPFQFGSRDGWPDAPMLRGISRERFDRVSAGLVSELADFVASPDSGCGLERHLGGAGAVPIPP